MLSDLGHGLTALGSANAPVYLVGGMLIGMLVGMLPGLGTAVALSVLLPFVYHMQPIDMVALMLGTQAGGYYSASITAIVLNTPGAPESFPTTYDGFPMTRRGEAGKALAVSAVSTGMGALISCLIFLALLQTAGPLVSAFKAPDYVGVIVMALVLVGMVGDVPITKVLIAGGIGLMVSFIGSDPVTAINRFTFGLPQLASGINVVPFALGVFALTQMVVMFGTGRAAQEQVDTDLSTGHLYYQARGGIAYTLRHPASVVRSAVIASVLGLLPGIGGFTGNYISYSVGKRFSKVGRSFGSGVPEGVMSAEGSSLAKEVGSLLPAVALGLPSGVGMVLFVAAMTIVGLQPGEVLLKTTPSLPYSMMWVMALAGLASCGIGLALSPWLKSVARVPGAILLPFIAGLAVLGAFTAVLTVVGIVELITFAVLGVLARKCAYPIAPMIIGLVLGGTFDNQVHITSETYGWSFLRHDVIADVALLVALALVVARVVTQVRRDGGSTAGGGVHAATGGPSTPAKESTGGTMLEDVAGTGSVIHAATAALFLACSSWYLAVALRYPSGAGTIPAVVAAVVVVFSAVEVVSQTLAYKRAAASRIRRTAVSSDAPAVEPVQAVGTGSSAGAVALLLYAPNGDPSGAADVAPSNRTQLPEAHDVARRARAWWSLARLSRAWREATAVCWMGAFVGAALLFGFKIGLPLAGGLYAVLATSWHNKLTHAAFVAVVVGVLMLLSIFFVKVFNFQFAGVF